LIKWDAQIIKPIAAQIDPNMKNQSRSYKPQEFREYQSSKHKHKPISQLKTEINTITQNRNQSQLKIETEIELKAETNITTQNRNQNRIQINSRIKEESKRKQRGNGSGNYMGDNEFWRR